MAITTLGYALLGLLAREDLTGYDISLLMREPISFYWHARHSQIYTDLAKLQAGRLVRHTLVRQTERPDKKIFSITPRGRAALKDWVTMPVGENRGRDELLLKTYAIWVADPAKARALYEDELRRHSAMLKRHTKTAIAFERSLGQRYRVSNSSFGDYATLRRGIGYERELIAWLRWMIEQFKGRRRSSG